MFVDFIYELRQRKVPVGAQETVALGKALALGMHDQSLDGFYQVARCLLIHDEQHLDAFDEAFLAHFKGIFVESKKIAQEMLDWLRDPIKRRELSDEEKAATEAMDLDEVMRLFEERLKEQDGRHDGGNRWIGTGGTSPFGAGGFNPSGIKVGQAPGGGGRGGSMKSADARKYRPYRSDIVLDVRQIEVALRKLRAFVRDGGDDELDIEGTIDKTAKNAGELEVVVRPPRRPNTRVILMMDVGGSMDPYSSLVSQVFSAAKRATHWRELRTYYFHNCVYGRVYKTEGFQEPVTIPELIAEVGRNYKLVFVGDACMAPYELLGSAGYGETGRVPAIAWLGALREHFDRAVWLNPEGIDALHPTVDAIRGVFPMFSLTLDGLGQAMAELIRGGKRT